MEALEVIPDDALELMWEHVPGREENALLLAELFPLALSASLDSELMLMDALPASATPTPTVPLPTHAQLSAALQTADQLSERDNAAQQTALVLVMELPALQLLV